MLPPGSRRPAETPTPERKPRHSRWGGCHISAVTLAEVHYVVRAIGGEDRADAVIEVLDESGIRRVDAAETWRRAAEFKHSRSPALGDAFALATAARTDATLLVGADDDYDDVVDVPVVRFRTDSA